ncbi:MAG: nitroreductase family protein [Bacteroidaceae bacterium]|nr:nitroreductase family protein [Bacteroidaceae bacterium]
MMKSLKNKIKTSFPVVWIRVFLAKLQETTKASKHLCTSGMYSNSEKLITPLTIATHALEKGMSIGKARYGFGQSKALELLKGLQLYLNIGGDKSFVNESCTVIKKYIEYNVTHGANMEAVITVFNSFCKANNIEFVPYGGIYELDHSFIREKAQSTFDEFSQSRFAVRDFGEFPISREDIERALKLCERTPTACNRQSQRVHIYLNKDKIEKLCKLQGGGRGFIDEMQGAILICSDLRSYDFYETNLPYVDASLYGMNLMYSLHYYDIASIPLTMGHKTRYTNRIMKEMNLPDNEVPILLVAIGSYKEQLRVAQSHRKNWKEYTEFI